MTLEKAIKILELNVPFSRSPEASQIKEAIEIVKFALGQKNIEIHLEEAFMKECECEIEKAKEQAVREFADRLKRMMFITDYDIDELVNELYGISEQQEGEENGNN